MAVPPSDSFNEKKFKEELPPFVVPGKDPIKNAKVPVLDTNKWLEIAQAYYTAQINLRLGPSWGKYWKKQVQQLSFNIDDVQSWDSQAYKIVLACARVKKALDLAKEGYLYQSLELCGFKETEDLLSKDNMAALKTWGSVLEKAIDDGTSQLAKNKKVLKREISDLNRALRNVETGKEYKLTTKIIVAVLKALKEVLDSWIKFTSKRISKTRTELDDWHTPVKDTKNLDELNRLVTDELEIHQSHGREKRLIGAVVEISKDYEQSHVDKPSKH